MTLWQRRVLSILSIGGGAIGITVALTLLFSRSNPIEWILIAPFIAIYGWGIWCGVGLLERRLGAERSSLWYWLVQVPAFGSPYVGYSITSGFHMTLSITLPADLAWNLMLGSTIRYSLLQSSEPWMLGLNIFAAGVALFLFLKRTPRGAAA